MAPKKRKDLSSSSDPLWYKDAIIYELHVRAFFDDNNDGVGDFKGLIDKLDYLHELGVTALWLLPFYPSPLKDDGYDIADYRSVHPPYGSMPDVKQFIREAHARGIKVITELVVNHTSDQHPWFQRARRAKPGSRERDFYVWSDKPNKFKDARIIFTDTETSNWAYDPVANSYYWHRFYSHQPDLNYDHPPVRKAVFDLFDFWFSMGVDGMRLDAVPYLYQREGTSCENLPETHGFLRQIRKHLDRKFENRMLLAEANQWPDDAAKYFGKGDECHMNFHFPLMPRLFMSLHMEDRFPIVDILEQTPPIPDNSQWALFLRNHDELTLEMVTDEERDYMYRIYASDSRARINLGIRRRLAPLLGNDRRRIELLNSLLFSLPGTPVIYYGDEIGMGDNVYLGDRNGVRTPMQWSPGRNAGFSKANPQSLYLPVITDPGSHFEAVNVETQLGNPRSLLWWMKRIIALRKRHKAFGRGSLHMLDAPNRKVLAFIREYEDEKVLVVANLSRFAQYVNLDLSAHTGLRLVELFGQGAFPAITGPDYPLTMGPHSFFWFSMQKPSVATAEAAASTAPTIIIHDPASWQELLSGQSSERIVDALRKYMLKQRWFAAKARVIHRLEIREVINMTSGGFECCLLFVRVYFSDSEPETYLVPISHCQGQKVGELERSAPRAIIANTSWLEENAAAAGMLFDPAAVESGFVPALLEALAKGRKFKGSHGALTAKRSRIFSRLHESHGEKPSVRIGSAEQSNTSAIIADSMILKLYRRLESGENPEVEIGGFLGRRGFSNIAQVAGSLEYLTAKGEITTLGILQEYVKNESDAWELAVDRVSQYLTRVISTNMKQVSPTLPPGDIFDLQQIILPPEMGQTLGADVEMANMLGRRTAQMHLILASDEESAEFRPEPFTPFYRRGLAQSIRQLLTGSLQLLRKHKGELSGQARLDADSLLDHESKVAAWIRETLDQKLSSQRIRIHGDYHLGQVLFTGKDFIIIDFEGEPARSMQQRRTKRSALRDVAGMARSFHYAALSGWHACVERRLSSELEVSDFESWIDSWHKWMSAIFIHSYYQAVKSKPDIVGTSPKELSSLLNVLILEKAAYEIGYELNNRPRWAGIPLAGICQVLADVGLMEKRSK